MKKKTLAMLLAVCLIATAVIGGSLAYFTDTETKTNTFTVGNVKIDLTEPSWDATGNVDADTVYPGEPLAKDPTVENIGNNPCFVRIKVDGLDQFDDIGEIIYRTDYVDGKLGDNWVKHSDGCFYYNGVLDVGETTDALFDQIVMPTGLTGGEEAQSINVTAEAVQAQGARPSFAAVEAMTVAEIAEWFDTCME